MFELLSICLSGHETESGGGGGDMASWKKR